MTDIFDAAKTNNVEQLQQAIANRADVNAADNNGVTPLLLAAYHGHLDVVKYLVDNGADVNKAYKDGATPLLIAAKNGHLGVVQHLLAQEGIKVNQAIDGVTPLHVAAYKGHLEVVQHLLAEEGIEVDRVNNDGATPLSIAERNGHVNIGAILLIHGAKFDNVYTEFYKEAINDIAQGIIDYDEYPQKKLAFAMGGHPRLGEESNFSNIDGDTMKTILDLAAPPKIELNKMQEQHRDAVQQRINQLQQERNTAPNSNVAANDVSSISPAPRQL